MALSIFEYKDRALGLECFGIATVHYGLEYITI